MKRKRHIFIFVMHLLHAVALAKKPYKAVVVAPIVDAIGSPIQTFFPKNSSAQSYTTLPVSGGAPRSSSHCPRLHQLLFNEMGTVIKEEGPEVLIKISNCFYITNTNNTPHRAYWILKKNIISMAKLEQNNVPIDKFPPPISFEDSNSMDNDMVITLIKPWHDPTTGRTFSAGTRFLKTKEQDVKNGITVHLFDVQKNEFFPVTIPYLYIVETIPNTAQKKIDLFVQILKNWARSNNGSIAYVWGGCSFTETTDQPFAEIETKNGSFYEIKKFNFVPKPGLDCSNLILRAAQLAGIPFFFKNSYTIAAHLKQLQPAQQLSPGDIIAIPGHVLVVADVTKNTLIEARGYKYKGQGKIQEIELNTVFKDINSFEQLVAAWRTKQRLERLGDDGSIIEIIKNFKLLSMRSIME